MNNDKYFINCTPESIRALANAMIYSCGEKGDENTSAEEVVQKYCGDTSVELVWKNRNYFAMLSTDSCISVLNIVHKDDERDLHSIEVD